MLRQPALPLLLGLLAMPAQSAILEFRPSEDYVWTGTPVAIDVVATLAPGERVGAYGLAITWNYNWHEFAGIEFGPFLGGPGGSTQAYDDGIGALVVNEQANAGVAAQDGLDEIRLFTFTLYAAAIGNSALDFSAVTLRDAGGQPLDVLAIDGSLTSVPGPATGLLLGSGLAVAGRWARRRRQGVEP